MEIVQKETTKAKPRGKMKLANTMHKTGGAFKSLFTKRKKLLVLSTMFALLCVTGYLNFTLNNKTIVDEPVMAQEASLFTMFRTTRDSERQRDINLYTNIMETFRGDDEKVNAAQATLDKIRLNANMEAEAEGLLMMDSVYNGYLDILVNRTMETGFLNVIIKRAENISPEQACTIMSHLQTVTGMNAEDLVDLVHVSVIE